MSSPINDLLNQYYKKFNDYPTIVNLSAEEIIAQVTKALKSGKPIDDNIDPDNIRYI